MREIPLTQGRVALVDDEDYEAVMAAGPWYAKCHRHHCGEIWYARRNIPNPRMPGRRTTENIHQFLMRVPGSTVDHINRNGLDNQRHNLRRATQGQQLQNTCKKSDGLSSQYKGVTYRRRRWIAQIQLAGCKSALGYFDDEREAALAYDRAARQLFGEFACVNFPEEV